MPGALPVRGLVELTRLAAGLPGFLRRPATDLADAGGDAGVNSGVDGGEGRGAVAGAAGAAVAAAVRLVAGRVARREAAFLAAVESSIDRVAGSPYRQLLLWAGCTLGDLRRMVAADGLDAALSRLHAAGVRLSAEEFRGRVPVRRGSFEMTLGPRDLDNPRLGGGIRGATSGSTGRGLPVRYGWDFLAGEALDELLLLASHGLAAAPLALWLPGPPGIAGMHNALVHARLGNPPRRWFSPSPPPGADQPLARWADRGWRGARRLLPSLGAAPEWAPPEAAERVARWLAEAPRPAYLKCFASSAPRLAAAAAAAGLDLGGQVVFAGGEPLTGARRELLARTGAVVFARYAATETGFIAGACPHCGGGGGGSGASGSVSSSGSRDRGEPGGGEAASDEMHLYADRLAVISAAATPGAPGALAFTSLSPAAPKVLLNVELGDHGVLHRRDCDCALGRAGLAWRVAGVHSPEKVAAEGVKLGTVDLTRLVGQAIDELGGGPDDFQIHLGGGPAGGEGMLIALAPGGAVAPEALARRLRQRLPELPGGALAAALWFDSGALKIERRSLLPGPGQKMQRVVRPPAAEVRLDPERWAAVHDRREPRDFAFRRGLELCVAACAGRIVPGALWADLGSGAGHVAAALAARGALVAGLDRDPRMAAYARRRWSRGVAFAAATAAALPLADRSCAGVVAVSLLGCVADPADLFAEAARVLVPGGTLCVTAMNRRSLLLAAAKLSAILGRGRRPAARYTTHDPAALAAALLAAGLVPERQVVYGHFLALGNRVLPSLDRIRRRERSVPPGIRDPWARQILLVARRPD